MINLQKTQLLRKADASLGVYRFLVSAVGLAIGDDHPVAFGRRFVTKTPAGMRTDTQVSPQVKSDLVNQEWGR